MPYSGEIYDVDVEELGPHSMMANEGEFERVGVTLRPHQRRALQRCREMEDLEMNSSTNTPGVFMRTAIGIYGDMVGSGKSHVMLALIAGDKGAVDDNTTRLQTFAAGRIQLSEIEYTSPVKTSLIVIPHTLATQWEGYLLPLVQRGLKVLIVSRMKALDRLASSDIGQLDVILVTNSFYDNLVHLLTYRGVQLRRVVVDEADTIAITSMMEVRSRFTWFVTAAYGNLIFPMGNTRYEPLLQQSVAVAKGISHQGFVRALFLHLHNSLARVHLKRVIVKNTDAFVNKSMLSRLVQHVMVPSLTPHAIRVLTGVVDRVVLECLDAGDIAGAVDQVAPENRHSEQSVVALMCTNYSSRVNNVMADIERAHCNGNNDEIPGLNILLAELFHKIGCLRSRLLDDDDVCCICLENTCVKAVVPCCAAKMCLVCIARWVLQNFSCVLCRRPLTFSDLHVIEDQGPITEDVDETYDYGVHLSKLQNLEVILFAHAGAKALIYSDHDKNFDDICDCLTKIGKTYDFVRGGPRQISNTVEAYKDDRIDVLLINSSHYGGGLNLENTTDVLMFQALNTEVEKQVIGRAQRMGRTSNLRVWHILHENEVHFALEHSS